MASRDGGKPASSLRLPKRGKRGAGAASGAGPQQIEQIPAQSYVDADEALDAGTQLEEKAERFAVGDKAHKYYRLALEVYRRALHLLQRPAQLQLPPSNAHGNGSGAAGAAGAAGIADAAYNAARVLFVLGTTFLLPRDSIYALQEATQYYSLAQELTIATGEDGLPMPFYLDVQFNLGAALLALAEQLDTFSEGESSATGADGSVTVLAQDAIACFESVLRGQDAVLKSQLAQEAENRSADIDRPPLPIIEASDESSDGDRREENTSSSADAQQREEYTSSLITPASALETIFNLHTCTLVLLQAAPQSSASDGRDDHTDAVAEAGYRYLQEAGAVYEAFPDGDKRSPDNDWNDCAAQLRYAPLELRTTALDSVSDVGSIPLEALDKAHSEAISEADMLLNGAGQPLDLATTAGRAAQRLRTQQLEQLGEILVLLARVSIGRAVAGARLGEDSGSIAALLHQTWRVSSHASKLLLTALQALDTSAAGGNASAAVLGGGGSSSSSFGGSSSERRLTTTASPTLRRRCALYSSASALSVLRRTTAELAAQAGRSITGVDASTLRTLADNARVYARKALAEVGLSALLQPVGTHAESMGSCADLLYKAPHGGLDSIRGEADAVLALLRALAARVDAGDTSMADAALLEGDTLCANVVRVGITAAHRPEQQGSAQAWRACLGISDAHVPSAAERRGRLLLEQATGDDDEEATLLGTAERAFWTRAETALIGT